MTRPTDRYALGGIIMVACIVIGVLWAIGEWVFG